MVTWSAVPSRTNANTTISWTVNEEALIRCTIQTPNHFSTKPCNSSWTGANLPQGYYSIYVQATDTAGNVAQPVRHSWFVGKFIIVQPVKKTTLR